MGREVRRVPADWEHPKDESGELVPLFRDGFEEDLADWRDGEGPRPDRSLYMPAWTVSEATHFQMYETCSEGMPISAVFESPELLARWLADTNASAFGDSGAGYEPWLRVAKGEAACSAVLTDRGLISGVEALGPT